MQLYRINPNLIAFYFGGDSASDNPNLNVTVEENWEAGCEALGVASYVVHNGNCALVYDTLCSPKQAALIREYLEKELGAEKITVVLSHWHLDHVGGNQLYADYNIISTRKTRDYLLQYQPDIEAGTLWGKPGVNPLHLPDIALAADASIFLNGLEVRLLTFHIHTDDGLCAFIPQYRALLPGDMLEDSASFITNPEDIPVHVKELRRMRELDIKKILPNHGRSFVIEQGGYGPELIDCVFHYLEYLYSTLQQNPAASIPPLQETLAPYFRQGLIHYWPPYETVHRNNVEKVRALFKQGNLH